MMKKKKLSSYNDGVCGIYVEKANIINDFNAKRNAKTLEDYNLKKFIHYSIENIREEDYEFAERMEKKLTMKIKTPLVNDIKSEDKVIIDSYVYDIIKIDPDIRNKDLYIYLEGGRKIEK